MDSSFGIPPRSAATSSRLAVWLRRLERPLLFVLLSLLLLVLLEGSRSGLGRTLFVAHLGVFLLWQPFIAAEQPLSNAALAAVLAGIAATAWLLTPWLLAGWIMLLGGVFGGKVLVFGGRGIRLAHLVALGIVVVALLILAVPAAFVAIALPVEVTNLGRLLMIAGLLAILFMPYDEDRATEVAVIDFIYSVFVFLILAVLVLGTLAAMQLFASSYVEALLQTTLGIGFVLLLLGWSWNPRAGVGGLGHLVSRYTLSLGVPIEKWLAMLATLAATEQEPATFLRGACDQLVSHLRWISGGHWITGNDEGGFGNPTGHETTFRHGELTLVVNTRTDMSPAMVWHVSLLVRLLAEVYADKRRTQQFKRLSYMEAVHETGARLTHDIKNLLQSLNTLCAAANTEQAASAPEYQALLRRQLPAIAARLEETLKKMKMPGAASPSASLPADDWWAQARRRYEHVGWMEFSADSLTDSPIPGEVFDGVLDNAARNATDKHLLEPGLKFFATLGCDSGGTYLTLCDDGSAFPEAMVGDLFQGPVASASGLGIGLYQAARMAGEAGYRLTLAENRDGRVCLDLRPG